MKFLSNTTRSEADAQSRRLQKFGGLDYLHKLDGIFEVFDAHKTRADVLLRIFEQVHEKSIEGALHKCQTSPKVCERDSESWFIIQARQRAVSCRLL